MQSEKRMLLDVNEFPKSKGQAFILALQHVLAMFVACITVPLIVYAPYAVKVGGSFVSLVSVLVGPTIVAAGIGTLFYLLMLGVPIWVGNAVTLIFSSIVLGFKIGNVVKGKEPISKRADTQKDKK